MSVSYYFINHVYSETKKERIKEMEEGSKENKTNKQTKLVGWFGFYSISTIVGCLTPNPFLWKEFYFKQFSLA